MAKPVPKVSGLVRIGAVVPATEEQARGLPSFHIGTPTPFLPSSEAPPPLPKSDLQTGMIPLSKLKIHPFNSRTQRTQERIEEVRDMLEAAHIQREPITVVPGRKLEDKGHFYILSGQTRYHAANLAGWAELNAQINASIDPDDHVAFFAASIEHNTSRPETDWDLAVKAKQLLDEGIEPESIRKALRRDARGYRRLMAMIDMPESILSIVRDNAIKLSSVFCEILKTAIPTLGEESVADIAKQVVTEELSRRSLEQVIERLARSKGRIGIKIKRATREFMLPIVIDGDKKAGEFKVMQSSQVEGNRLLTLSVDLPENLAETLKSDIEAAIYKLKVDGRES